MRGAWLIVSLCLGCSSSATNDTQNTSGGGGGNGGSVTGGTGGALGGAAGVVGTGGSAAGGQAGGAGTGGDPCQNDALKINEVSTTGSGATDEFIELYNPRATSVSLDGYSLQTAGPTGTASIVWQDETGQPIAGYGYFVIKGAGFAEGSDGSMSSGKSIPDVGGVGLFVEETKLVDALAYGTVAGTHPFLEGAAANNEGVAPSSMARSADGHDCDNNSVDFVVTQRTPGSTNTP
jgi:5'-nucleotidase